MNFYSALTASGLRPRDVIADGRWHRCPTDDKPKKRNGCYLLDPSGAKGVWKNYATDAEWNKWHDDTVTTRADARRTLQIRERDIRRRAACVSAMRAHFAGLPRLLDGHQYLFDKGLSMLGCSGLRIDGDLLVIPMYLGNVLMSYQTITPAGEKKYRYGCATRNCAHFLSRRGAVVTCLAEGFATGLAIYQALPSASVVVCFDAGNLAHVAERLSVSGMVVICADNDWETEQRIGVNPGVRQGTEAARKIGCKVAYPTGIAGTDWADALKEWASPARLRVEIMRQASFVRPAMR